MNSYIRATQARKNFFELLERTKYPGNAMIITYDGLPAVAMISFEEFEKLGIKTNPTKKPLGLRIIKKIIKR